MGCEEVWGTIDLSMDWKEILYPICRDMHGFGNESKPGDYLENLFLKVVMINDHSNI